jgi:hypothetical protein
LDFKRKNIILITGIVFLTGITASVIRFIPSKSTQSENNVLPQEKVAKPTRQIAAPTSDKITAATTTTISSVNPKHSEMLEDVVIPDEESQEGKAEREEPYKDDTPEQAQKRASLEKEIKTLSQAKAKEEKELSTLISSLDEAQKNSQLPPDELKKKQAEVKMIKMLLMRTYSEKLATIDSSLQDKLQQYRDSAKEKNEPPEIVEID